MGNRSGTKRRRVQLGVKEADVQRQIIDYLKLLEGRGKLIWQRNNPGIIFRKKEGRGYWKMEGSPPGSADLLVFLPDGVTLHMEVKRPGGRLSSNQVEFRDRLSALGHRYVVVKSIEEAQEVLSEYIRLL